MTFNEAKYQLFVVNIYRTSSGWGDLVLINVTNFSALLTHRNFITICTM